MKDQILEEIESGAVSMRPKAYFASRKIALRALIALLWAAAAYFVSLILFKFHLYDPFGYLSLGRLGWRPFYTALPWRSLSLLIIVTVITVFALRCIDWTKRKNFVGFAVGFAVLILLAGVGINATGVHQAIWDMHVIPYLYHGNFIGDYWVMGHVTAVDQAAHTMSVLTPNNEPASVIWDDGTKFPQGNGLQVGNMVQVVGELKHGVHDAEGIVIVSRGQ